MLVISGIYTKNRVVAKQQFWWGKSSQENMSLFVVGGKGDVGIIFPKIKNSHSFKDNYVQ